MHEELPNHAGPISSGFSLVSPPAAGPDFARSQGPGSSSNDSVDGVGDVERDLHA